MPDDKGVKIQNKGNQNVANKPTDSGGTPSDIQNISVSGSKDVTAKNIGGGKLEINVKLPTAQIAVPATNIPVVATPGTSPATMTPPQSPEGIVPTNPPPTSPTTPVSPPTKNEPGEQLSPATPQEQPLQSTPPAPVDQTPIVPSPTPNPDQKNNLPPTAPPIPGPEGTPPNQKPNVNPPGPQTPATDHPTKVASDMNADRQRKRSFGERLKETGAALKPSNIAKNTANAIKDAPRKMATNAMKSIKQIGADLRSTRQRKLQLLKKIDDINDEIKKLQSKIAGLTSSWKGTLFRLFFPGLYSRIMGILEIPGEKMQSAKVKILEAKYTALLSVKGILEMSRLAAAVFDSFIDLIELTVPTIGIIWLLSPIFLLFSVPFHFFIAGTISSSLKMITKEVDNILKPLKDRLDKEKKILALMNQRRGMRTEIKNMPAREGTLRKQQAAQAAAAAQQSQQETTSPPNEPSQPKPAGASA